MNRKVCSTSANSSPLTYFADSQRTRLHLSVAQGHAPFHTGHQLVPLFFTHSGYPSTQKELLTPAGLRYELPTPLRCDDYFSNFSSVGLSPTTPHEPVLSPKAAAPFIKAEDTSLDDIGTDRSVPCQVMGEGVTSQQGQVNEMVGSEHETGLAITETSTLCIARPCSKTQQEDHNRSPEDGITARQEASSSQVQQEERSDSEELAKFKPKGLDVVQPGEGSDDEEVTKEEDQNLPHAQNSQNEFFAVPGWHSDSSSVDVEPPTPRRCNLSTDNLDEDNG
eukprot:g34983.t1